MNADLEKVNSELESFNQVVSKDLSKDLQDLQNKAQSLQTSLQSQLSGEAQKDLQHMVDQTAAMNKVIQELTDLTQLKFEPHLYKQVDLNEIMNVVMDGFFRRDSQSKCSDHI